MEEEEQETGAEWKRKEVIDNLMKWMREWRGKNERWKKKKRRTEEVSGR